MKRLDKPEEDLLAGGLGEYRERNCVSPLRHAWPDEFPKF